MIYLAAASCTVFWLDWWSKRIVRIRIGHRAVSLGAVVWIRQSIGAKDTYQSGRSRTALVFVWFVAFGCAAALHASGLKLQSDESMLGVGAALGGAAGNLVDIVRRGEVLDFIDLGWWPVFNIADVGIVAGLIVAFWPFH